MFSPTYGFNRVKYRGFTHPYFPLKSARMDIDIQLGSCVIGGISGDVEGGVWEINRPRVGLRKKDGEVAKIRSESDSAARPIRLEERGNCAEKVRAHRVRKKRNVQGRGGLIPGRHVTDDDSHGPEGPICKRHGAEFRKKSVAPGVFGEEGRFPDPDSHRDIAPAPYA